MKTLRFKFESGRTEEYQASEFGLTGWGARNLAMCVNLITIKPGDPLVDVEVVDVES